MNGPSLWAVFLWVLALGHHMRVGQIPPPRPKRREGEKGHCVSVKLLWHGNLYHGNRRRSHRSCLRECKVLRGEILTTQTFNAALVDSCQKAVEESILKFSNGKDLTAFQETLKTRKQENTLI